MVEYILLRMVWNHAIAKLYGSVTDDLNLTYFQGIDCLNHIHLPTSESVTLQW